MLICLKVLNGSSNHRTDNKFEIFTPQNMGLDTTFVMLPCLDPEKTVILGISIMATTDHLHKNCCLRIYFMLNLYHERE